MFKVGDRVIYSAHGVCTIIGIEAMCFGGAKSNYYCLQPLEQPNSRYYVPSHNETAVAKLKVLMNREELLALLHSDDIRRNSWIADEGQRKLRYKELITVGDRGALLNMVYCLYRHKQKQQAVGRKFHQCDEGFLHDAQRLLNSEFSLVFDLQPDQVGDFIRKQLSEQG